MKYSISKIELENDLLFETLQALHYCFISMGLKTYVIWATARDLMMKLLGETPSKRKTQDLDVAIALSDWSQFDRVSEVLQANFFNKGKPKQKFYYKGILNVNNYEVDIVPFGDIANNEIIGWPPNGIPEMSVKCFTDVMEHAVPLTINKDFSVYIAPLAGQFFIKLDSWMDRHDRNHKDAEDMFFILERFFEANIMDDQTPPDDVDLDIEEDLIRSAQWIGSNVRNFFTTDHLYYYLDMIQEELEKGTESELIKDFVILYGDEKDEAFDTSYAIWNSIKDILNKELTVRNEEK